LSVRQVFTRVYKNELNFKAKVAGEFNEMIDSVTMP